MKEPQSPFVRVGGQSVQPVDITTRVWCKNSDYWALHYDLLEQVRKAFDSENITIPFNQLDVKIVDKI